MEENDKYTLIPRHDTSTNWSINNPVLVLGEYGVEDDTHRIKRGDGVSDWETLPYECFGLKNILSVNINQEKHLIILYTDGTTTDAGSVLNV